MIKNVVTIFCFGFFMFLEGMEVKNQPGNFPTSAQQVRLAVAYQQLLLQKKIEQIDALSAAAIREHGRPRSYKDSWCCLF